MSNINPQDFDLFLSCYGEWMQTEQRIDNAAYLVPFAKMVILLHEENMLEQTGFNRKIIAGRVIDYRAMRLGRSTAKGVLYNVIRLILDEVSDKLSREDLAQFPTEEEAISIWDELILVKKRYHLGPTQSDALFYEVLDNNIRF
ncbi:hypothetical protein [Algivirga pacifica]|uniref:Uncharacterized protein n=1 Tax=Algivirga pacifica TaxID=1162670 RepID=A0ABP9D589_9BACT